MKTMILSFVFAFALVALSPARAADAAKETTLSGDIGCAKCSFGMAKECHTGIKVMEGGKDVVYLFVDGEENKKNHEEICKGSKAGKVTGKVSEKDGKKCISPTKVEYAAAPAPAPAKK